MMWLLLPIPILFFHAAMPLAVKETRQERAFSHLTQKHADFRETLEVNGQKGQQDDKRRRSDEGGT